jgi:Putative carbonic anhydrase
MCNDATYLCQLPFETERIHAAAMYCSDGRFGEHMDDFLQNALALPRYDRLVVPGGSARLVDRFAAFDEQRATGNDLKFLVDAHGLERVILIAHSDCAYYTLKRNLPPDRLEEVQKTDLLSAAKVIQHATNIAHVDTYFARQIDDSVQFEPVT